MLHSFSLSRQLGSCASIGKRSSLSDVETGREVLSSPPHTVMQQASNMLDTTQQAEKQCAWNDRAHSHTASLLCPPTLRESLKNEIQRLQFEGAEGNPSSLETPLMDDPVAETVPSFSFVKLFQPTAQIDGDSLLPPDSAHISDVLDLTVNPSFPGICSPPRAPLTPPEGDNRDHPANQTDDGLGASRSLCPSTSAKEMLHLDYILGEVLAQQEVCDEVSRGVEVDDLGGERDTVTASRSFGGLRDENEEGTSYRRHSLCSFLKREQCGGGPIRRRSLIAER
uniref:Uncharacterized protein n=1 Tax=Chromera velia CCMP2878 TaxID=1169474 RepID=A0A0G4HYC2_9ALVE|eukprot:Cvel_9450.t1-p1 / transcript=Cvel_9450.t1 / gene=Cvel_9450 / organism=Chromera_velia_CCMP2878 / gene_product=hypothetical protein / transcript_product=hypothetical protein / location=Cvel_scaffold545:36348-37190(-) / protein_length=281 / sequence_SO=supercontig / SO=protein_coding / is_pseudo=false